MLLLASVLHVTDREADSWQRLAPGQWRPDRMLFLEGEPLLGVVVLVDGRDAPLKLCDASVVAEIHVMRDRGQVRVRYSHVIAPHPIRDLVSLLVLPRYLLPRAARVELGDGVAMMELGVAGDIVVPRVALAGVLHRQDVQIGTAVVLGVAGRSVRLRRRRSGFLEPVGLLHLLRGLQDQIYPVGALVVDATAAHGLRVVHDHCPGHPGQVAQVALGSLPHHLAWMSCRRAEYSPRSRVDFTHIHFKKFTFPR